jgi:hypothetical protein
MNSFFQFQGSCALQNEFLHLHELIFTSGFESARVVEYEIWVASEHDFILNVMLPGLVEVKKCQDRSLASVRTYIDG